MRNLTLLVVFFPISVYSQISIQLGGSAGMLYAFHQFTADNASELAQSIKQSHDNDRPRWGSWYALSCIVVHKKWYWETGIAHTTSSYAYRPSNFRFGDVVDDAYGFAPVSSYEDDYLFSTIRIPITVGYAFNLTSNKRHHFVPKLGVSNNLLYNMQVETKTHYQDGRSSTKTDDLPIHTPYSVSAIGGLTYQYELKRLSISASYVFNQCIMPIASHNGVSAYESFSSAQIGLLYRVK